MGTGFWGDENILELMRWWLHKMVNGTELFIFKWLILNEFHFKEC